MYTSSIKFDPNAYGIIEYEDIFFVIIRFAFLPIVMLPTSSDKPIANAPLIVAALIASSGDIPIFVQARETTKFIFPDGDEPGL